MKTIAIIQARMGSTRLPGKVLKPLAGDTVLGHVVRRVRAAQRLLAMISESAAAQSQEDCDPMLVSGPVYWRGSVTERPASKIANLKLVRED